MHNIPVSLPAKIDTLRQNPYFADLSQPVLDLLAEGTRLQHYERGEIVCWQGEPCTGLYMIRNGSVKLFKLSPKGRELIIKVFEEGATFNEVPVFDLGPNVINVACLDESEIWIIDAAVIRQVIKEEPEIAQAAIQNMAVNLRMLIGMVEELSFHQVTNLLARLITQLTPDPLEG